MRKSFVSELHGEWSEFADECLACPRQVTQVGAGLVTRPARTSEIEVFSIRVSNRVDSRAPSWFQCATSA
jgi:hypothetical protein